MKIKMSCTEANHVCDKTQYKEAGLWEKILLNLHLLYCKACRKYTARNSKLTKTISRSHLKSMDTSAKSALKEQLEREMLK